MENISYHPYSAEQMNTYLQFSITQLSQLAEQDDALAHAILGVRYLRGNSQHGVHEDPALAAQHFHRATELGCLHASFLLAYTYFNFYQSDPERVAYARSVFSTTLESEPRRHADILKEHASQGDPLASFSLGLATVGLSCNLLHAQEEWVTSGGGNEASSSPQGFHSQRRRLHCEGISLMKMAYEDGFTPASIELSASLNGLLPQNTIWYKDSRGKMVRAADILTPAPARDDFYGIHNKRVNPEIAEFFTRRHSKENDHLHFSGGPVEKWPDHFYIQYNPRNPFYTEMEQIAAGQKSGRSMHLKEKAFPVLLHKYATFAAELGFTDAELHLSNANAAQQAYAARSAQSTALGRFWYGGI